MHKIISIVGNRSDSDPERFEALAKTLGTEAYKAGYSLRVLVPDAAETPLFDKMADRFAFEGYLEEMARHKLPQGLVELGINPEMWHGGDHPFAQMMIGGYSLDDYSQQRLLRLRNIDNGQEAPFTRRHEIASLIEGPAPVDAVLLLDGGTAGFWLVGDFMKSGKVIPLPYCGGLGERALEKIYGDSIWDVSAQAVHRLMKPFFGRALEGGYTKMDIAPAAEQVIDGLAGFFGRPQDAAPTAKGARLDHV